MRAIFRLTIASLSALALWACDDGSDGDDGGDTDNQAACQADCDSRFAEELADCDACDVAATLADGNCTCLYSSCVGELCAAFCEAQDAGASSAQCYLDSCTCG